QWRGSRNDRSALDSRQGDRRKQRKMPWFQGVSNFFAGATSARVKRWGRCCKKEEVVRNLLLAAASGGLLMGACPASAQIHGDLDGYGAGVQVGRFGFGVGPRYDYGWRGGEYYAYGDDCPMVRERIRTNDGRVIVRTRRVCR